MLGSRGNREAAATGSRSGEERAPGQVREQAGREGEVSLTAMGLLLLLLSLPCRWSLIPHLHHFPFLSFPFLGRRMIYV